MKTIKSRIPYTINIFMIIIFTVALVFSLVMLLSMERLWTQTSDLYEHPLIVQRAASEIGIIEYSARETLHDYVITLDEGERALLLAEHESEYLGIFDSIEVLKSQYLGDPQSVLDLETAILVLHVYDDETIRLVQENDTVTALARVHSGGIVSNQHQTVIELLNVIQIFASNKGISLYNQALVARNLIIFYSIASAVALFLVIGVISLLLRNVVIPPLKKITSAAEKLAIGQLDARVEYDGSNEFGYLADRFNHMADFIEEESYLTKIENEVSKIMFEDNSFIHFNQSLLKELLKVTNSQVAAIYRKNEDNNKLERLESIGLKVELAPVFFSNKFEGDSGISIASNQIEHFKDLTKKNEMIFSTVVGDYQIQEMITIPIHDGSSVIATITLGKVGQYQDLDIKLLNRLHNEITARYSSVLTLQSIKELNNEINSKNSELEAQTMELFNQSNTLTQQNIELEVQKTQLNNANQLKNTFLSNMSHELRTPLNSVISLAYVLNRKWKDKLPLEDYQYLEVIERNGRNLLDMVNELLDLSKIESGKVVINQDEFNLNVLLDGIVNSLSIQAHNKGLELSLQNKIKPEVIKTDKSMLVHIITNLVGNAIKFTDKGKVEIKTSYQKGFLQIKVIDTGIGISKDQFSMIFEEFRQVDESSSKKNGGAGLGLAISKKYAMLLGGEIEVESIVEKGSTFTLKIPVELIDSQIQDVVEFEIDPYSKRILLVDDSLPATIQTKYILDEVGYIVDVVHNGKQAIEYLKEIKPDGIILDLMMPEMDGFEVLRVIRDMKIEPIIPILILSSKLITKEELSFLKTNHVYQLIQKGLVKKNELLLSIKNMLSADFSESKAKLKSAKLNGASPKVLIVEDNPDNMITVKALLGDSYQLIEATDGMMGVDYAKLHKPDLILMDLALPKIDGYTALTIIKGNKDLAKIPIIAMTAKAMTGNKEQILSYGFDGYISKPIDPQALSKELEVHLHG